MKALFVTLCLLWGATAEAATTLVRNTELKLTLDATAGNVTAVTIPAKCRYLLMYFETSAGWYNSTGTDGAAKTVNALPMPADSWVTWRVPGTYASAKNNSTVTVYIASAANSGVVYLYATEDGD